MIGHIRRDPSLPELFAEVTAQVPARFAKKELTSLTLTSETWSHVDQVIESRGEGEAYLGWWHSHPTTEWRRKLGDKQQADGRAEACAFLSADDIALHRTVFPRAWSVALLVCDASKFALFGWRYGMVKPRKFHIFKPDVERSGQFTKGGDKQR
jgi:hypothetical protein